MDVELDLCRKCKGAKAFRSELEKALADRGALAEVEVRRVRCQDLCKGAVVGLEVAGTPVWFRRLRGRKDARALAKLAVRAAVGPIPKRLVPHHVDRRDGRRTKR